MRRHLITPTENTIESLAMMFSSFVLRRVTRACGVLMVLSFGVCPTLLATDATSEKSQATNATDEISYNRDIRPLLSSRCFSCHGPDAESREAALRLDQPDGDEGSHDYAIVPGAVEDSEVWNRVTSDDESILMPPPESHLKPLSEKELRLIRVWIDSGAEYERHWSFVPPARVTPPEVQANDWNEDAIDKFVWSRLQTEEMQPSAEADPRTLIRRVTFDLTGLPPTRQEIHRFLNAYSKSSETAFENLVDELMQRPQFGEHMARHWLDLVRFADTNGMHKDFFRNHLAYRDWVIRSFNENLRYDDFLRYQVAGDLYESPSRDQLIASGFHRLHLIIDRGTALPEESHVKNVLDRVTAVGTAFMGLTVQCAQCHDHKFDPISQHEFYSLYAFFNNIDATPETVPDVVLDGMQEPFVRWPTEQQVTAIAELDSLLLPLNKQLDKLTLAIRKLKARELNEEEAAELESLRGEQKQLREKSAPLKQKREELERNVDKAMVMKERPEVRDTRILVRGQYDNPGERVDRGTPQFLPPLKTSGEVASRMDLAEWFVAPENPLTARVAVNRFWQLFFGVGIVKTAEDFGNQGSTPSHPELLDELAASFVESGWDMKALVKRIVLSKTYRQSSHAAPSQFRADSENRMLARGPRYRLDAEMIRDQILATSGVLSKKMYGRSVKPPQPDGLWAAVSMTGERFSPDTGEDIYRRSIYTFWKRAMPPPQMTILNAPIRDACIARRERTNTPTQALLLLNEREYQHAARRLAEDALESAETNRLSFVWETITAKLPDSREREIMNSLLADLRKQYSDDPQLAEELCDGISLDSPQQQAELAAWTMICSTIYNLDITKTKD